MPFPWTELLRMTVGAFFGALGFTVLVHAPVKAYLPSGLIAAVSYVFYWLLQRWGVADALSVFSGALLGSLLGHLLARKLRIIHTVFLMAAIVPVVPGLGLYRMMASFGRGETMLGANLGIEAMITIAMLALGLSMGSFINRVIRNAGASAHEKKQRTK